MRIVSNLMDTLFNPSSVAVIGASLNPNKLGYSILKNILDYGFEGKIFPVNIKYDNILGHKVYRSILDIEEIIDDAIIVIPANIVNKVVRECAQAHVKNAIIISSGFKESGEEGRIREEELINIAKEGNLRIVGPNSLGIISSKNKLNATFASEQSAPLLGNIYLLSQSGAVATSMLDWARENNIGFSRFVSIGNKADFSENDFIEDTKEGEIVAIYLESLKDGKILRKIAEKITQKNPIVVLMPGKSKKIGSIMMSHSGSMATDHILLSTLFKQTGMIEVDSLEKMFNVIKTLSFSNTLPKGNKTAIITNAGGPAVITTDTLMQENMELASLEDETQNNLKKILPEQSNVHNPIDLIGDAQEDRYSNAIKIIGKDKNVDNIIVILTPQITTQVEKTAESISKLSKEINKNIFVSFIGGYSVQKGIQILDQARIPNFPFPEQAVYTIHKLYKYTQYKENAKEENIEQPQDTTRSNTILEIFQHFKDTKVLDPYSADSILKNVGIPTPQVIQIKSLEEANNASQKIGYPVVMKLSSEKILHKSDVNAVITDINNYNELEYAYKIIYSSLQKINDNNASIIIQKQILGGVNVIVGMVKHANIGNLILFGMGGVYTQLFKDISTRLSPISKRNVLQMINETKASYLLRGYRGDKPKDIDKLVDLIITVSNISQEYPEISQIDINPAIILNKGSGIYCVDSKIILE